MALIATSDPRGLRQPLVLMCLQVRGLSNATVNTFRATKARSYWETSPPTGRSLPATSVSWEWPGVRQRAGMTP